MRQIKFFHPLLAVVFILAFVTSCELFKDSPTATDDEKGEILFTMSLKPLTDLGLSVDNVYVKITGPTNTEGSLTISSETSASGTFSDFIPGTYNIEVVAYNAAKDTLATGSGQAEILPGQTTQVTINMTFNTGVLEITVIWGSISRTVTDIDGNTYQTVKIGNQWWMAENLKVTHYRDGTPIPNVTDNTEWVYLSTDAYCAWENDDDSADTYGYIYNWYAVDNSRKIAPVGWHVPTDAEWTTLTTYLGGTGVAGGKMKETGTSHWASPNIATNESGFSALPGGCRHDGGTFNILGVLAYFWSSSQVDSHSAWSREMGYDGSGVDGNDYGKRHGFSVRLIRD